jgi:hypothetical protein
MIVSKASKTRNSQEDAKRSAEENSGFAGLHNRKSQTGRDMQSLLPGLGLSIHASE